MFKIFPFMEHSIITDRNYGLIRIYISIFTPNVNSCKISFHQAQLHSGTNIKSFGLHVL